MRVSITSLFLLVLVALTPFSPQAGAAPKAEEVPTFQLRARVTSVGGAAPTDQSKFNFRVGSAAAPAAGGAWSEWIKYDRAQVEATLKGYPAIYMAGFPIVTALSVDGVVDPTVVEAELKFDENGKTVPLAGELFGPNLGILLWRDEANREPRAGTMADYNQARYWKPIEGVAIPAERRPKQFPIVDRFIGGDDDRRNWREGINALTRAGLSAIMLPPSKPIRALLKEAGVEKTAWAVYSPPGYVFRDAMPGAEPPQELNAWAAALAKQYTDAGYAPTEVAAYALSDEPGWYYPAQYKMLDNPAALTRFHEYLQAQGLQPADVGVASWEQVKPLGRSGATDLPRRRLFYWTQRFFPYDSTRYFADSTRAMERAFYPDLPLTTNFNFFNGRFYVPGPIANNADKQSPDAAMGGHDWLEFGRMRGSTMLWTEDWFGDDQAYQWSFYCAKLRCAADKGGVRFGGYVIPRTAGDRADGILQKMLTIVGSGGKAIKFFVFGPEYNFPGNCYSENPQLLKKIAEANAVIGAAEELLWPGQRPRPQVAILSPKSAQVWDLKDQRVAQGVSDATNTNLNGATMDYMAEVFDLYLALQHKNVPVDFVEEEDLSAEELKAYKVLYVTEPNVPEEGQRGLVEWVKAGGKLVTVTGAAQRDRYDEPCDILADATGIREQPRAPMHVANLDALKESGRVELGKKSIVAYGPRGALQGLPDDARVPSRFTDGQPALVQRTVGKGSVVHFAFMPGLSYVKTGTGRRDGLPVGFDEFLRDRIAGGPSDRSASAVWVGASREMVETPVLLSEKGAAITVLNWTGEPIDRLNLTARLPFVPQSAEAVRAGKLEIRRQDDGVHLSLPVGSVDVILLRP